MGYNGHSCPHATKTSRISKTFRFSINLKISYLFSEIVLQQSKPPLTNHSIHFPVTFRSVMSFSSNSFSLLYFSISCTIRTHDGVRSKCSLHLSPTVFTSFSDPDLKVQPLLRCFR